MKDPKNGIEDLIAESRRIQDSLVRVVIKLDVFVDQLREEVSRLQEATDERIPEGEAPPHTAGSGDADQEGGRAGGGGVDP